MKEATNALNNAIVALNDARNKSDEIVSGINQAIERVQKTSVITVKVYSQTKEHLQKINHDFLASESQLFKEYIVKQHQNLNAHEDNIQKMLRNNEGIWFSNFWLKALIGGIVAYTIVTALCYLAK